jgi:hypothetical protein
MHQGDPAIHLIPDCSWHGLDLPADAGSRPVFAGVRIVIGVVRFPISASRNSKKCYSEFRRHCIETHGLDGDDTEARVHLDVIGVHNDATEINESYWIFSAATQPQQPISGKLIWNRERRERLKKV